MSRDRFPLLFAGALLLMGSLGAFLLRAAQRSDHADQLSTYRASPDGARALYLLAEQAGLPVTRWQQDFALRPGGGALVVLGVHADDATPLEPAVGADDDALHGHGGLNFLAPELSEDEQEKLLEHVAAGHTLIYLPCATGTDTVLSRLGFSVRTADPELGIRTLAPAQPSPYTLGVERLETRVQGWLDYSEHATPLLIDAHLGGTVAAMAPHGGGRVIVLTAPELAKNVALARADNAQWWLSLLDASVAPGEPLHFDEFHHGFSDDRSIAHFALRHGLHLALAQLLLGVVFWALALRRFGRPRLPALDVREEGTDALRATSRLYREGKHHAYAAELIAQGLAQELAPSAGVPLRTPPGEVAAALRARHQPALAAALEDVAAHAKDATSDRAVEKVARLAALSRLQHSSHRRSRPTARRRAPHADPTRS